MVAHHAYCGGITADSVHIALHALMPSRAGAEELVANLRVQNLVAARTTGRRQSLASSAFLESLGIGCVATLGGSNGVNIFLCDLRGLRWGLGVATLFLRVEVLHPLINAVSNGPAGRRISRSRSTSVLRRLVFYGVIDRRRHGPFHLCEEMIFGGFCAGFCQLFRHGGIDALVEGNE